MNKTYEVVTNGFINIIYVYEDDKKVTTISLPDCDLFGAMTALSALDYQLLTIKF